MRDCDCQKQLPPKNRRFILYLSKFFKELSISLPRSGHSKPTDGSPALTHLCRTSAKEIDLCQVNHFVATPAQNCFEGEKSESLHLGETYRWRHGEFLPMDEDLH